MATVFAYVTKYSAMRSADIHSATQDQLAKGLVLSAHDFGAGGPGESDYVKVGTAEVSIKLYPRAAVVNSQVATLRTQAEQIKAQAAVAVMQIEKQINSLLFIENEVQP